MNCFSEIKILKLHYACVCVCVCVRVFMYICVYALTCTCLCVCLRVYVRVCGHCPETQSIRDDNNDDVKMSHFE